MAKNNLSLAIVIRLLTDNFNKGATRVKATLLQLQRNFLALSAAVGAGSLALSNILSKMIEVSKETARASIALKNVSGSIASYGENQKWLLDISKKYGVEINALTSGFAKFKAAADISNMSLEDQRKIFESVSRASVAFGLSAEDQKGIFMALSQMMSKNKVMAEELRLQLAERMPVAIQAMAKAVGVSVEELDSLMKQGKVMSTQVLPRFAEELTKMTPNIDLDNLNKSLVDLSNTFQSFAKDMGIDTAFKGVVETATQILSALANNTKAVMTTIKAAIFGAFGKGASSILKGFWEDYERAVSGAVKKMEGGERAIKRVAKAQEAYNLAIAEQAAALEEEKLKTEQTSAAERQQIEARVANANKNVKAAEGKYFKAVEAQKAAAAKVSAEEQVLAAQATATGWTKAMNAMKFAIASALRSLKAMLVANLWTAAIAGATALAAKLWEVAANAMQARRAFNDLGKVDPTQEEKNLRSWQRLLSNDDKEIRVGAIKSINGILGTQLSSEDEINSAIENRIKLLHEEEKLRKAEEAYAANQAELEKKGFFQRGFKREEIADRVRASDDAAQKARENIARLKNEEAYYRKEGYTPAVTAAQPTSTTPSPRTRYDAVGGGDFAILSSLDDAVQRSMELQAAAEKAMAIMAQVRDKSEDWKMSDLEILEADKIFNESKIADLITLAKKTGVYVGEALGEGISQSQTLDEAIRLTEISDALTELQSEITNLRFDAIQDGVRNIDSIVDAFSRLHDTMEDSSSGWEKIMAVWSVFESVAEGIISTIETIASARAAQAEMERAAAAQTVIANTGEAASAVGKDVAKQSGGWAALIAVPAAIAAILAAFAAIPKFANGGVVGGNSRQGDKVLARLNSGEGVLTPEGLESLHDAANPRNARTVQVVGVLKGRGRDLVAVINAENNHTKRIK